MAKDNEELLEETVDTEPTVAGYETGDEVAPTEESTTDTTNEESDEDKEKKKKAGAAAIALRYLHIMPPSL
ncbi:MAG: hypothetical protein IJ193_08175 [Bacilli bacterium]|nr:hypothetical protein [Bacilli bacterium]